MYVMHHRRVRWRALLALAVLTVILGALGPSSASASNDLLWRHQYGPAQIQAPSAWTTSRGEGVIVAVIDSGVDLDHPDLRDKLVVLPGSDFGDGDDDPDDDSDVVDGAGKPVKGHGTHVAGIAAAITDNGIGVAGVAPGAQIMPVKVFGSSDENVALAATRVTRAIRFAVSNGARVINLSLGGFRGINVVGLLETPCTEALSRGALCVVSAGNEGDEPSGYDRDFNGVIVTANDERGAHADFGQHADTKWAVSAPGVNIWSTYPMEQGEYAALPGTSMSAPHVAGVAALLFAQGLDGRAVAERIVATADPMPDPTVNGAGRVNAARAVGAPVTTPEAGEGSATVGGGGEGSGPAGPAGNAGADPGDARVADPDAAPVTLGDLSNEEVAASDDLLFDLETRASDLAGDGGAEEIDGRLVITFVAAMSVVAAALATWLVRGRLMASG